LAGDTLNQMKMTEWLANVSIGYVIAAIVMLFVARLVLGRYKTPFAKSMAEVVESALMAIALVFLFIRPFVIQAFFIPSPSMCPTLLEGDHILVNKFIYRFREPRIGEIIVFRAPKEASDDGMEKDFIKRLVGLPGDVIEVKEGALYRNDKRVTEPYILEQEIAYSMRPTEVPSGKLFVLGDNRNDSRDSHWWGPLDRKRVLGKAIVRFWPIRRFGSLH
jgi:signal peptidase I